MNLAGFAKKDGTTPFSVKDVVLLGSDQNIAWQQTDAGLEVTTPATAPNETAVVYKITTSVSN